MVDDPPSKFEMSLTFSSNGGEYSKEVVALRQSGILSFQLDTDNKKFLKFYSVGVDEIQIVMKGLRWVQCDFGLMLKGMMNDAQ